MIRFQKPFPQLLIAQRALLHASVLHQDIVGEVMERQVGQLRTVEHTTVADRGQRDVKLA